MKAWMNRLLNRRTGLVALGVVSVILIVVLAGPLLSVGDVRPLAGEWARGGAAAAMLMATGLWYIVQSHFRRAMDRRLYQALERRTDFSSGATPGSGWSAGQGSVAGGSAAEGVTVGSSPAAQAEAKRAAEVLDERFRDALGVLRKRRGKNGRGGRRWLYQLPWYVIIGPPGSGKTTAISNSGLGFPLAEKLGRTAVRGIGGTRNCDWWFTEDAVLIDTAGRYTTQDSDAEADKAGWLAFLRLLKKYRRRQPLNGVLVAIGLRDLSVATPDQRLEHAAQVRARVAELYRELGSRLPVYVLFTKADLVAGFTEYFDDLGREGREAVWGMTFGADSAEAPDAARDATPVSGTAEMYERELTALATRLDERMLERMQNEGDLNRRAQVFGFPQQVLSLREMTAGFLREAFEANSFEEPVLLRGVYFCSGTQTGTPLDRVAESMSRAFGLKHQPQPSIAGQTRSFFLHKLLREVVFGESWLVESDPRLGRRLRRLQRAVVAAAVLIVVVAGGVWGVSFAENAGLIDRVKGSALRYAEAAKPLNLERVEDGNLRAVVPLLDGLRNIETGPGDTATPSTIRTGFGLDQGPALAPQTLATYHKALGAVLLPRLVLRVEGQIGKDGLDLETLYEGLKVYLMLGGRGPAERDAVRRWLQADFRSAFPNEADAPLRASLDNHVAALLSAPLPEVGLNGDLIASVQEKLRKVPMARRVLDRVAADPRATALPVWSVADQAGPSGGAVLQRRSGRPLSAGIPGFYTRDGFLNTFLPMLPTTAAAVLRDGWILGLPANAGDGAALERDATALYLQEFSLRWDGLLQDVTVRPVTGVEDALRTLNILSAPTSPIRLLVVSMAAQTRLDPPAPPASGGGGGGGPTGSAAFAQVVAPDTPQAIASNYSQQHFRPLQQLVDVPPNSEPGATPPIDGAIRDLGNLYRAFSQAQVSGAPTAPGSAGAMAQIDAGSATLPEPVRQWIMGVSKSSSGFSAEQGRQRLGALWTGSAGRLCQTATVNRYPFAGNATEETPLGDFARLFAKGGAIDSFFAENLANAVDMGRNPWQPRPVATGAVGVDRAAVAEFQRAAAIRDSMFTTGGQPSFGFTVMLEPLDPSVGTASFRFGNNTLAGRVDGVARGRFRWPVEGGEDVAELTVTSPDNVPYTVSATGPWAIFRLLDQGSLRGSGGADRTRAQFTVRGYPVTVTLQADSAENPLSRRLLGQFRCPALQ